MKSIYLIVFILGLVMASVKGQDKVKEKSAYYYDVIYSLPQADSLKADSLLLVQVVVYLDDKAFKETGKLIVIQQNVKEHLKKRTIKYNLKDRILGWDVVLKEKYKDISPTALTALTEGYMQRDKIKLKKDAHQVEIELGYIHISNTGHEVVLVELEDEKENLSGPLTLNTVARADY